MECTRPVLLVFLILGIGKIKLYPSHSLYSYYPVLIVDGVMKPILALPKQVVPLNGGIPLPIHFPVQVTFSFSFPKN